MSTEAQRLYELLPAIHRIRDAEIAKRSGLETGPLEELIAVIASQVALLQENIEQSYDDLFIETCSEWVVPYIGDVIGYQSLHGKVPDVASPRAEVAHTIALRRRKGTAAVLEQLARDVTAWPARVVEAFELLAWSQFIQNHVRLEAVAWADVRRAAAMELVDGNSLEQTIWRGRHLPPSQVVPLGAAIARALAHEPGLVYADEPTGNLHDTLSRRVMELLMQLVRESGSSLLMVTHNQGMAAYAGRRLLLREGRLSPVD